MLTRDENISRRVGRMEALASDLAGLPAGYQPTELELLRARELYAALGEFSGVVVPEIGEAVSDPDPAGVPQPEIKTKPDETVKSGKK